MKCPKCGYDNPAGTLFCEECDWRTDQPAKMEFSFPRIYIPAFALVLGIVAVVLWYFEIYVGAIAAGAAGMFLGGYSVTFVRITDQENRAALVVLSAVAICTAVFGFIMGLSGI